MRVLVIEDDPAIQEFLQRGLSEAGYVADQAKTAREAEALVCEQEYAAIVLDLGLPDRDGFDLMARLRAQGVIAPMLILSARRSVNDRVRGLEQGGDDYMTKPFAIAELTARLREPGPPFCAGLRHCGERSAGRRPAVEPAAARSDAGQPAASPYLAGVLFA